jgi:hypothetical protein
VQDFLDADPIRVAPECGNTTRPCMFASWCYWPECILSKSDKGTRKKRKMLGIEMPYLVCFLHVDLRRVAGLLGYFVNGIDARHSS